MILTAFHQPMQFKLDPRLARLLGVHTQTRPVIINALWQYIKTHRLQDPHEREFINCDKYLEQVGVPPRGPGFIPRKEGFWFSKCYNPIGWCILKII